MRARNLTWQRPLAVLAPLALVMSLGVGPATAQEGTLVTFDFEDGIAGWGAPLEYNAGDPFHADEQSVGGDHSLGVPVSFPAGEGWAQAGVAFRFDEPFSASGTATFHVYAPIEGLQARFQFNDPWTEPISLRPLSPGWNEIVYDIDTDFAFPVSRVHEIFLFVVAQNLPETFEGNLYVDDVSFTAGDPGELELPDEDIVFDFDDGVAGWSAPEWLESNAGQPFQDDTQVHSGSFSMALPVHYAAGSGWEQSGVVYRFQDAPVNVAGYVAVSFQVYAPVAGLSARFQLNDPWTEPATMRALEPGWNRVTYDIGPSSEDFDGGIGEINEIILFVVAQNLAETYDDLIWFDTVEFIRPAAPIVFDFEDNVDGWFAPDWLDANDGEPFQDGTHAVSGDFSLALPVHMLAGSGWEQAGAVYRFQDAPVNLLGYETVSFHVYAPVTNLSADFIFNDPWNPPTGLRPLELGWNELVFDLTPASPDWPGGVASATELILRVVGQGLPETYQDLLWFDDVTFNPGTAPVLSMISPQNNETVATPSPADPYEIMVQAGAAGARELVSVTWASQDQTGALSPAGGGIWSGDWDLWAEPEGVTQLAVTATDEEGESTTARVRVLVRNSNLTVDITAPEFDEEIAGTVEVVATVTEDDRFPLSEVVLYGLENDLDEVAMASTSPGTWTATLDTTALADGIESLAVEARDAHFGAACEPNRDFCAVRDLAHVIVRNEPLTWDYVGTGGTSFVHDGEPFRYAGWNEYELFTPPEHFGRNQESELGYTIFGEVLLPGTPRQWEDNVDRQLLEAARHGQTVLRTWAFNRNDDDAAFQRLVDGEIVFQEATFQRLDYILDSARRHGIRVILALDNYWEDYGGINRAAQWLGLENKLQFFTDPAGIALYQEYAENLITRVNTVSGVTYAEDPTVFAWELMNEPRTDCAADPTPDRQFCDPTGEVMRDWMSDQATFIKSLAPHHLVSPGGEAHGYIPTPGGPIQFGGADEGNNNIPFFEMDVPEVDFLTFHPYPNAWWAGLDRQQTHDLVVSSTRMGVQRGKPTVMEEWGLDRTQALYTADGTRLEPGDPGYEAERVSQYQMMLQACYRNGCAGNNVWMFADWSDRNLNVNLYRPGPDAQRDAEIVADMANWSRLLATGQAPEIVTPGCQVSYTVHGQWPGGFNTQVWVTNTGPDAIHGWELGWWFEAGQELGHGWGMAATQDGPLVTATNLPWNGTIRPGQSLTVGFIGARGSTNPEPPVFFLNGEICTTA